MSTIWKYELEVTDIQRVPMPAGARLLSVQGQPVGNATVLMLWAQVDPTQLDADRVIAIVGTGNPAPDVGDDTAVYVGTAVCPPFVWHVFDCGFA